MRLFITNPNNCLDCGSKELQEECFDYRKSAHYFCKNCYEAKGYDNEKKFTFVLFSKAMKLKPKNNWIINKLNNDLLEPKKPS